MKVKSKKAMVGDWIFVFICVIIMRSFFYGIPDSLRFHPWSNGWRS